MKKRKKFSFVCFLLVGTIALFSASCAKQPHFPTPADTESEEKSEENDDKKNEEQKDDVINMQNVILEVGETFAWNEYLKEQGFENVETQVASRAVEYSDGVITAKKTGIAKATFSFEGKEYAYSLEVKEKAWTDFLLNKGYFYGKKVVFYGDSITAKVGVEKTGTDYVENLCDSLGFTYDRFSEGGALYNHHVALGYGRNSCCNLINEHFDENAEADYAVLFFGTNDFGRGAPIGTDTDSPTSLDSVRTVKGAIRFSVEQLRKNNPDLKILLLTPIIRADVADLTNKIGVQLSEYVDAVESMGARLNCRVVNMYDVFTLENITAGAGYTSDSLHPNSAGHKIMSDYLLQNDANVIREIKNPVEPEKEKEEWNQTFSCVCDNATGKSLSVELSQEENTIRFCITATFSYYTQKYYCTLSASAEPFVAVIERVEYSDEYNMENYSQKNIADRFGNESSFTFTVNFDKKEISLGNFPFLLPLYSRIVK